MFVMHALAAAADAAEVVWVVPPAGDEGSRVAAAAGATRGPLTLVDLRAAATDVTAADARAYEALAATLKDVRKYETQLDGELLIMEELERPLAAIGVVRDEADRGALFSALAYQGFAVDRFFAAALKDDPRAQPYRVTYEGLAVERPWADAVALDPEREVTPYDVAEAPQRVAFGEIAALSRKQLPARLVPGALPKGATLIADGRPLATSASGTATVVPGRHLVHAALDGQVIARWDLRLRAGEKADLEVPLSDEVIATFLANLDRGVAPPEALRPCLEALGGEVWIADPRTDLRVYKVTADAVSPVTLAKSKDPKADDGGLSVAGAVSGGWLSTGDFLLQDPTLPATKATVNAPATTVSASADFDLDALRFGVGLDAALTLGAGHVARYGEDGVTRVRAHPYVAAGLKEAQVTLGVAFPHHPTVGLRATIPVVAGVELRGLAWYGLGLTRTRDDGSTFEGTPLFALGAGVGYRL